jgi:HAMP domain-containing protein
MIYHPHEKRSLRAKNPPKIPADRSAPRPYRRKPISQYSSAGIYIKDFPSIYDAASEVGATPTAIQGAVYSAALCAGFLWRRATGDTSPISPARKRGEKKRLTGGSTARKIDQIDLKTGQVIQTFVSVRAAARFIDRDKANLTQVANGVKKSSAGFGWRWHLE